MSKNEKPKLYVDIDHVIEWANFKGAKIKSKNQLAEMIGAGYQTLSNFNNGRSIPQSIRIIHELHKISGLPLDEIIREIPQNQKQ